MNRLLAESESGPLSDETSARRRQVTSAAAAAAAAAWRRVPGVRQIAGRSAEIGAEFARWSAGRAGVGRVADPVSSRGAEDGRGRTVIQAGAVDQRGGVKLGRPTAGIAPQGVKLVSRWCPVRRDGTQPAAPWEGNGRGASVDNLYLRRKEDLIPESIKNVFLFRLDLDGGINNKIIIIK